jgi:hypothetical protein
LEGYRSANAEIKANARPSCTFGRSALTAAVFSGRIGTVEISATGWQVARAVGLAFRSERILRMQSEGSGRLCALAHRSHPLCTRFVGMSGRRAIGLAFTRTRVSRSRATSRQTSSLIKYSGAMVAGRARKASAIKLSEDERDVPSSALNRYVSVCCPKKKGG